MQSTYQTGSVRLDRQEPSVGVYQPQNGAKSEHVTEEDH